MMKTASSQSSFLVHLVELRRRLLKIVLGLLVGSVIGLVFSKEILSWLQQPLIEIYQAKNEGLRPEQIFQALGFGEVFTLLKAGLLGGLFLASPFIFYQFWSFLAPALTKKEKRALFLTSFLCAGLFVLGALFGYFQVLPFIFNYLLELFPDVASYIPRLGAYFGEVVAILLAFGIAFELPIVIFILGKMGVIDYRFIHKNRRYMILILFLLSAFLTPPDPVSQCLLAIPLWLLYELGGLTLLLQKRKK